jgi:hypothetical protein
MMCRDRQQVCARHVLHSWIRGAAAQKTYVTYNYPPPPLNTATPTAPPFFSRFIARFLVLAHLTSFADRSF